MTSQMDPVEPSSFAMIDSQVSSERIMEENNHKVILVAEDNLVNQKITVLLLEKLGLQAHVVSNGKEAVEAVKKQDYPVVLMDCHMPEMDGFEATREIRRLEMSSGRHTPIIAVTALAMVGDRERCIDAGMDDYISKPIDKERLKTKLTLWMKKEFVFHNQKLAEKFFEANSAVHSFDNEPIDLAELEVFYGSTEEVEDVLRLFLSTTEKQLTHLFSALEDKKSSVVARLSHELKGASASVGAKEMSLLALQLEQQAGQLDWLHAEATLQKLETCFKSLALFVKTAFSVTNQSRTS